MSVRLLQIADASAYRGSATDVPLTTARLAAHPDLELFHVDARELRARTGALPVTPLPRGFTANDFQHVSRRPRVLRPPEHFDLAFCRTLKPFPPGHLSALSRLAEAGLRFANDPRGIRRQLEHRFLVRAAGAWLPEHEVTGDPRVAADFLRRHTAIVAKRRNSCGGRGVYRVRRLPGRLLQLDPPQQGTSFASDGRCEREALFRRLLEEDGLELLLMRFLPRVVEGDKRILVVDGEVYGAYLRRARDGSWIQNVSTGAVCERAEVTPAERALVAATAPEYRRAGIHTLGYDLLRDDDGRFCVSEINAGNIGGFARVEGLGAVGVVDRLAGWLTAFARDEAAAA